MRRVTLRIRLLAVSILFSLLTVGGILTLAYAIVYDGMLSEAEDRFAQVSSQMIIGAVRLQVESVIRETGDSEWTPETRALFASRLDNARLADIISEAQISLHDSDSNLIWGYPKTSQPQIARSRESALREGRSVFTAIGEETTFQGMLAPATLPIQVAHIPVDLPGGSTGILEIVHHSIREEQVINAIRPPMSVLALISVMFMIVIMQYSMDWVLRLVRDLRLAADSIDAGKLDVRLPESGDHEITALARSLNSLIDRLQRRSEAQIRFIADASHELATPVAGIRGYVNILKEWGHSDPEVRAEAIAAIDRESSRMARLSKDLLALVRDERTLHLRNVRFDLNARCREVLAVAATRYIAKGLEFVGPEEGQLMMVGDPDRIEDAIAILLDNAAKYTQQGIVSVQTRCKRGTVVVEVSDTGIGIHEDDLPNIFDRFYRSDASRSKGEGGFGLGLPIAKAIIDGVGGSIDVRSTVGVGTVFTLRLPQRRN